MKKCVIAAGLLLCAGLIAFLALRSPAAFAGSRVKDPDSYTLDVRQMSGTDVHTLELCAGVVLILAAMVFRYGAELERKVRAARD